MPVDNPAGVIEVEQQPEQHRSGDSQYDSDDDAQLIEKWGPTVDAILAATKEAFPSSPRGSSDPEPNREEFRQYWHGAFTQLLETVAADSAIPEHLTSPPVKKFVVKLFDERHSMCCPCSLPDVDPTIVLENSSGVTKLDLVRGLHDYLYGEASPGINTERVPDSSDADTLTVDTPLLYCADWMSCGSNDKGERLSYYTEVPEAFMYCCPSGEFDEKAAKDGEVEKQPEKKGGLRRVVSRL